MPTNELEINLLKEFDRQVENLLQKEYPTLAEITEKEFLNYLEPLKEKVTQLKKPKENHIPFVIVIKSDLVPAEKAMPQVEVKRKQGSVDMNPLTSNDFSTIKDLYIPNSLAYLLINIDTDQETLNITPSKALEMITEQNRFPITIDEGVAIVTHFPEVLIDKKKYNCFSMLASRRGDQRVPALWISYGKPRLGWCWDRNPHTWLGSASCERRIGA